METIRLACSVERMTLKDADSAESVYLVCPKIDGPETIARAELTFSGSEPSDDGYFSLRLEGIEDTFVANYRGNGTYVADLSRIYAAVKKSEAKRLLLRWIPGKEMGVCPVVAASGDKAATLALAVSSTRPFVPIASFSTSDGSTLSVGALDGRELYSRPIFRNVFGYPVTIYYDSSIANSASHIRLPKGIRLSFLQSFDGSTWTKGDGERVAFVNASGSTSVKFDAKGSGLYAKQVDELWRIVDAYTGGYAVFNSSGYLTRVVDGYGSTLLSVTRSLLSATATDQFGNTVSLSTNKLILNGGTHVLSFSKSSGYLSSITYSKGTADAGESIQFSCDATGASSIREPSGEVLRANFLSDGRVSAILKGVLQGTSFETENRLDIAYDDQQASCTNLRGRKTDVTFDDADRVETVGDDTGGLRSIFPAGNRTFAGFASTEYLRKMLGSYPVEMYGSSSSIAIEQGQVPVLAGHMMEPGRRYCVMATVDFSSSAVPDGSSRSFVISPNFTYGSGMSLSLNFSSGHGTVRTLYGFVEPTASAGLLSVAVVFSGMPGVATIKSLSVVACSYNDFCYVDSSGSIGPFFGTNGPKEAQRMPMGTAIPPVLRTDTSPLKTPRQTPFFLYVGKAFSSIAASPSFGSGISGTAPLFQKRRLHPPPSAHTPSAHLARI